MHKLTRKPYTKEQLDELAKRMENRLGAQYFYHPVAKIVEVKVVEPAAAVSHSEECRCNACVLAYLNAMEKETAKNLQDIQVTMNQTQEISVEVNYIG